MRRLPHILPILALSAVVVSARCGRFCAPSLELQRYAASFVPFQLYSSDDCFTAWNDAAGLLAALELTCRNQNKALAIGYAEAEPYVRHMAEQVLDQFYDPDAPNGWGPCSGHIAVPLPDPPSGVAAMA